MYLQLSSSPLHPPPQIGRPLLFELQNPLLPTKIPLPPPPPFPTVCMRLARPLQTKLAVLGIFTDSEHGHRHRTEARKTWLAQASRSASLDVRFVARTRGLRVRSPLHAESRNHGDFVFINASSRLSRSQGPLATLWAWMHCAVARWPNTELLGKADDDVMLLLPSITAHLRGSLDELRRIQNVPESPSMLWGVQESYHWDVVTRRPDGFDDEFSYKRNCMLRNPLLKHTQSIGPFNFAKGACLFVSMGLTRQLLTHRVKEEIEAAMAAADSISAPMRVALSHLENPRALPWEDVLLGWALTTTVASEAAAFVHIGRHVYAEEWYNAGVGLGLAPSTLILHNRGKRSARLKRAHRWSQRHHCAPPSVRLECAAEPYISCAGATWRRCTASTEPYAAASCSVRRRLSFPTALFGSCPHSPLAPATPCSRPCSRPCCPSPLLTNLLIAHWLRIGCAWIAH